MIKTVFLCGFAAAVLGASAQPLLAQPEPASLHVSYADLNLATDDGAARMLARLQRAASKVCEGHRQGVRGVDSDAQFQACRNTVLAQSVEQVSAPRVAELYAGRPATQLAQASGSH
jgi:UrcA family protein